MKSFKLTEEEVREMTKRVPTPFMVVSVEKIAENYRFMRQHMPRVGIYYAIKANPDKAILETLAKMGSCFDVASAGEIECLSQLGVPGDKMIYANPVKSPKGLTTAAKRGVRRFTFDDESEIPKMAQYYPGADVLVRISVRNNKAKIDLNTKFGTAPEKALPMLQMAKKQGLNPIGICFHVGSQSLSTAAYEEALLVTRKLFDEAEALGMHLTDLDIGGGFPVPDSEGLKLDLANMMESINYQVDRLFPDTAVWAEPGRYICGTAVNLVASVIGTKKDRKQPWYIIDESIYGALSGIIYDHWEYPVECFGKGAKECAVIGGPSCDGIDVLYRDINIRGMEIGDKILVSNIGAYSTVSATRFNGFEIAPTLVGEQQPGAKKRMARSRAGGEARAE